MSTAIWPCRITGHTTAMSGKPRRINAMIDGAGDCKLAMLEYMRKRKNSYEWLGVELTATTPLGQRVHVTWEGQ